jgi:type IV pilus assembly protein PilA
MKLKNKFTLIELLVVIAIIGILATIIIPSIGNSLHNSKLTATQADSKTYEDSIISQSLTDGDTMMKYKAEAVLEGSNPEKEQIAFMKYLIGVKDLDLEGN